MILKKEMSDVNFFFPSFSYPCIKEFFWSWRKIKLKMNFIDYGAKKNEKEIKHFSTSNCLKQH